MSAVLKGLVAAAGKKGEAEIRRYPNDGKQQYKNESKLYDSLPL